ncbi:MAG: AAA family ATPase [Lachnospiraceae bacterium]
MDNKLMLPTGIEDFKEIRTDGYYYVDKTALIEQVLDKRSKVTLFTRPRRFGKTLNMSMLRYFFETGTDSKLFNGLYISQNAELCEKYMGKYPVIAISLKGVDADSYTKAKAQIIKIINREARRHRFLLKSENLDSFDKELLTQLLSRQMEEDTITSSLQELTEVLEAHFSKKVVVLIDEYDVPLAKAYENGYYDKMVLLIRNLFGNVLKTNDSLAFAVLTGCLRIAKESIFTGLNNFTVYSITDEEFDETFGFTDREVQKMLAYYGLDSHFEEVKAWYDGYRFGTADVYCPWDVVYYCKDHQNNPNAEIKNYWINTSGNEFIQHFVDSMNDPHMLTKSELELLVSGDTVVKQVDEMITYKELYSNIDNMWSTLFMTGYLTQRGKEPDGRYHLAIPNREICDCMVRRVLALFKRSVSQNQELLRSFCNAMLASDAGTMEHALTEYMGKTISIRDSFAKSIRENFYHGLLIGILGSQGAWKATSNKESGDGFSDILIEVNEDDLRIGMVLELKYSKTENALDKECDYALQQIEDKNYDQELREKGYTKILKYGIAFYHKKCRVKTSFAQTS